MAQLIVYFSRRGENYVSGRIQPLSVGNTEVVARRLQVLTGADLFQLEPVHPYSDNYNQCIEQAQADQRQDARPAPLPTRAPGHSRRMSASLRPRPLPSWVQKGRMVLPVKSKDAKKVKTHMGMVPQ